MDKAGTNILEGEASESDEEISDYPGFVRNTMVTTEPAPKPPISEGPSSSVVVSGEAAESDDEDAMMLAREFPTLQSKAVGELEVQSDTSSISIEQDKPKFESPFHRKIYDTNFSFRLGIVRTHLERYDHITNRLKLFLPLGNKSQNYVQETLQHYRSISETTKELNDNLESLLKQTDLPRLKDPFPL